MDGQINRNAPPAPGPAAAPPPPQPQAPPRPPTPGPGAPQPPAVPTSGPGAGPLRMSHEDYVSKCYGKGVTPMTKGDFEGLDDEEHEHVRKSLEDERKVMADDDDDKGDEEEEEEKSLRLSLEEEELAKSTEFLQAAAATSEQATRQQEIERLSAQASAGTLEKSGRNRLAELLQEQDAPAADLSKSIREEPSVAQAFEASEFLAAFGGELCKSLDQLNVAMDGRLAGLEQFNRGLARGMDALAKSLASERVEFQGQIQELKAEVARLGGQTAPFQARTQLQPSDLAETPRAPLAKSLAGAAIPGCTPEILQKSGSIPKNKAQAALSRLFDQAVEAGDAPLAKSYGAALTVVNVSSNPDWRRVQGVTPEMIAAITQAV